MPCRCHRTRLLAVCALLAGVPGSADPARAAAQIPGCRLDGSKTTIVEATLKRAVAAYAAMGKPLPIASILINPASPSTDPKTLDVYVVTDAPKDATDAQGCSARAPREMDALDALSVRGGCVVTAVERMEMRCSSGAVSVFAKAGRAQERESIALLYVLSHELAHLQQRRLGEYAGRIETIDLAGAPADKLEALRSACDPVSVKVEEEADAMSFDILVKLIGGSPYRETVLSERGSVYSNIDQLALAGNDWQKKSLPREFVSQPKLHKAFNPQTLPAPEKDIEANARSFVCSVLTGKKGAIAYPGRAITHPPMEKRLQRMAEKLKPVADALPKQPGDPNFTPIAVLQGDLGPILTYIYRETGVYLSALQSRICTRVNGPQPGAGCPK